MLKVAYDMYSAKMAPGREALVSLQLYQVDATMVRVAVDIVGPLSQRSRGNHIVCVTIS